LLVGDGKKQVTSMKRAMWPATAIIIAAVFSAGAVLSVRSLRPVAQSRPVPQPTVTVTAKPRVITRYHTRTVTVTRTISGGSAMQCGVSGGKPLPPDAGTVDYTTTCTVTWQEQTPASNGTLLVLTDPAGASNTFAVVGCDVQPPECDGGQ
jgi:hypothetical protein